jgi:hypothetical protein
MHSLSPSLSPGFSSTSSCHVVPRPVDRLAYVHLHLLLYSLLLSFVLLFVRWVRLCFCLSLSVTHTHTLFTHLCTSFSSHPFIHPFTDPSPPFPPSSSSSSSPPIPSPPSPLLSSPLPFPHPRLLSLCHSPVYI